MVFSLKTNSILLVNSTNSSYIYAYSKVSPDEVETVDMFYDYLDKLGIYLCSYAILYVQYDGSVLHSWVSDSDSE